MLAILIGDLALNTVTPLLEGEEAAPTRESRARGDVAPPNEDELECHVGSL